jgi:hypothetical protein
MAADADRARVAISGHGPFAPRGSEPTDRSWAAFLHSLAVDKFGPGYRVADEPFGGQSEMAARIFAFN